MSKSEPTIQKFMTTQPFSIEASESLRTASEMMAEKNIRHLPVMKEGEVYGILSERDIKMALGLVEVSLEKLTVEDACHQHAYQVSPDTKLHEVTDEMAAHHYGSALVVQNKHLVGIFTAVDACRAISAILQQRYHEH